MTKLQRAQALLPTVKDIGEGCISVESLSLPGWRYLVRGRSCTCEQWQYRKTECAHMLAVDLRQEADHYNTLAAMYADSL
jgi:hypothetical protein